MKKEVEEEDKVVIYVVLALDFDHTRARVTLV